MPGLKLKGLVERIAPQTTIKNNIKGYAVRIAMKGLEARVLPGMTANVSIPVASSENALALPMAAVFSEQGERFVFVKKDDRFERRPVQIGVADYDYAEVLNGVTEGEIVSLETPPGETAIKLAQKPAGDGTNRVLSTGSASGGGGGAGARPAAGARPTGGTR
jgi:multidrug efflux pump subunit AcrA (membrane-fusion protein)